MLPVGEVGFKFWKHFPGHGWFEGIVEEVRPGAEGNRERRVVYPKDGDIKDMRLDDIKRLVTASRKRKRGNYM